MANRIGGEHEIGIEYFMKVRAYISIGVVNRRIRNRTSEISDTSTFRAYIPYKTLSVLYSVYYIHTEPFIILAAFLFQIFPKCLICR